MRASVRCCSEDRRMRRRDFLASLSSIATAGVVALSIVLCFSAETAQAQDRPLPAEIQQLNGKLVRLYHDVDLTGAGKPSMLHAQFLTILLRRAGATVVNSDRERKQPDVVIF